MAGGYEAELIALLREHLHLPDQGSVRMKLTLRKDGSLVKLLVLKAESEKNRKYLEINLPQLRFPPPPGSAKEECLVVTFYNE